MKSKTPLRSRSQRGALLASCLTVLLSACSDQAVEEPIDDNQSTVSEATEFYITLNVTLPEDNSTRSFTDNEGSSSDKTQAGFDKENLITSANIYFFDSDNHTHLLTAEAETNELKAVGNKSYFVYAKIEKDKIKDLFRSNEAHVYVVANITPDQKSFDTEEDFNKATFSVISIGETSFVRPYNNSQYCPMSNKDYFKVDLSALNITGKTDTEIINEALKIFKNNYRDKDGTAAHLWNISDENGIIPLERSIARIDYYNHGESNPVFQLKDALGPDFENVELELIGMQLFNISKSAFMFRHTSDGDLENGTRTGGEDPKIFGNENNNSNHGSSVEGADNGRYRWIYDCDWDSKVESGIKTDGLAINTFGYFLNQSTTTTTGTGTDAVTTWSIAGNGSDGYITYSGLQEYASVSTSNNGFIPWHYVMENTMPSIALMGMPYSTGVAFKMKLHLYKVETTKVEPGPEEGASNEGLEEESETETKTEVTYSQGNCPKVMMKDGTYQYPQWDSEGGYWYFTYRYLIEHNNENDGKISGNTGVESSLSPMHIGVVRNNIYQLKINSISNLPQPHDPDNLYMAVSIHILDWVKRSQSYDL